jgi:hypothetical protein
VLWPCVLHRLIGRAFTEKERTLNTWAAGQTKLQARVRSLLESTDFMEYSLGTGVVSKRANVNRISGSSLLPQSHRDPLTNPHRLFRTMSSRAQIEIDSITGLQIGSRAYDEGVIHESLDDRILERIYVGMGISTALEPGTTDLKSLEVQTSPRRVRILIKGDSSSMFGVFGEEGALKIVLNSASRLPKQGFIRDFAISRLAIGLSASAPDGTFALPAIELLARAEAKKGKLSFREFLSMMKRNPSELFSTVRKNTVAAFGQGNSWLIQPMQAFSAQGLTLSLDPSSRNAIADPLGTDFQANWWELGL